ncbi:hypothetical protein AALP_AA8G200100 [Arabis alpina]|uniref:Uncharacterized protein n=1 Tax=Arabis alpina TaxID=50452 RepID=A0A087G875_ARAAL|nr:hypothetical protein AALP_AA8G200100 [Arabis alpina]
MFFHRDLVSSSIFDSSIHSSILLCDSNQCVTNFFILRISRSASRSSLSLMKATKLLISSSLSSSSAGFEIIWLSVF